MLFSLILELSINLTLKRKNELIIQNISCQDDQVFFYNAYKKGFNIYNCKEPFITHLNHGLSMPGRIYEIAVAQGRNFLIFWHRFLYCSAGNLEKPLLLIAIVWRLIINLFVCAFKGIFLWNIKIFNAYIT